MADIKSMFSKMAASSSSNGDAGNKTEDEENSPSAAPPQKSTKKKEIIEQTYQKKTQLEHILLRPDTYIGSVEKSVETMWIYDTEREKMVQKQIEFVPGLYKIFDEILVNAADNKQRDKSMDCIKIEIKPEENIISVWNNGKGIPVVMHKEEKMFVPTMIFGHLLTSSNYNDNEEKVTGGRNGYGAKLCNIFSTKFTVETFSKEYKKQFKQTWGSNMTKASEPKIKEASGEDYTKITFMPDLSKFKMEKLDQDIVALMSRRAYDVAASTRGVKVFLNNKRLPVKNFKDYIDLYIKGKDDSDEKPKVIHEIVNERWEVALTISDRGFQQVSFVNSIATTKGGRHVDYVTDMIVKQLIEVLKKKNKGGINIRPFQVKNHMWLFMNCLIVNPTFDSQTKENMTLQMKSFGSKCNLSEKFINQVTKSGIVETVLSWAKFKAQNELAKTSGRKQSRLKGIAKLEDANEAGTKNALKCTLILTEGDSAKSTVMSGLAVVGRDYYGVFPLRGKLLNTREATHKQILENQEINNIIKIMGLQYKKKYNSPDDMKTLRYGKIMIMTDQDQDGSHIKGLLINFIHHNWPELLKQNFIEQFITPIVKARKKNEVLSFYSLPEFEEWRSNTPNSNTYSVKYYKGLGTSDAKEGREYFTNIDRHRIRFKYSGQQDDDHIVLAFSKKQIENRKEWLTNFMVESRRRKEIGLPEKYLYAKDTRFVTFTDFINMELVLFSNGDNIRSIPCLVDGLKPGQRKILYVAIKRNDKKEVKVSQLVGSVMEKAAYHHGDTSLAMTIVNMAQNFVGSNNINLLEPRGQFGTRLAGGKDSASPRYIFTKLSPLTRLIFHPHDDALLKHEYDDNMKIEPQWYIPILPMVLVNGADGIGTGWMTKILNYNPRDIVANVRHMLDGEEPKELLPWYKNFTGTIEYCGDSRYVINGEISILERDQIEITELPVGTWTQNYKENVLEPMLHGSEKIKAVLSDYKDYTTDTTIKYVITLQNGQMEIMEKEGLHKTFKLQSLLHTTSMCAFDEYGCLKRYDSVMTILKEFYVLRLKFYEMRKDWLTGMLGAEAAKLSAQARFIMEKCNGELVVENKKRKTIVDELIKRGYPADPVQEWKQKNVDEEDEEKQEDTLENEEDENEDPSKKKKTPANHPDIKKFDYLLGMSMWMLTEERKNELLNQKDNKLTELNILKKKSPSDLWREDLDAFIENLDKIEKKERDEHLKELHQMQMKKEAEKPTKGRKKVKLCETMPSPMGERIAPTISEDLKKKIQMAVKTKANRLNKGIKKENIAEEEEDEFDSMVKSKKTLKDKLGTPDEIDKKVKKKKEGGDGLKQSKLNFPNINGTPKKKGRKKKVGSEDEDELEFSGSGSDVEFLSSPSPTVKERFMNRRAATKVTKYAISDDEDDKLSDKEEELFDNDAVIQPDDYKETLVSSDDETKPTPRHETSEDMFDNLVGRKKENEEEQSETNKRKKSDESDSDVTTKKSKPNWDNSSEEDIFEPVKEKPKSKSKAAKPKEDKPKKPRQKKKKSSDDEDSAPVKKVKAKKKKDFSDGSDKDNDDDFVINDDTPIKKTKSKKKNSPSDDDDDFKLSDAISKKGRGRKKIAASSDDDFGLSKSDNEDNKAQTTEVIRPARAGRNVAKSKYTFDDSDESI
ncbi:DNA topoisomerase 2 isoform X1 [Diorhabda sublineata]|uniref:DNA topoisomerase 2 isoform X1 n=1 Tax=Diorhabda sublineata TaxID=1163346 RepID=UPI0024E05D29|nr:DNA topoisomerase 2 isoform X1 [Diorhabda sublineata]